MQRIITNVWRREMGSKLRGVLAISAGGLYDGRMPTIRGVSRPYRLFFYSFDCNEPMHIHAERERMKCKFWMDPIVLASN